MRLVDRVYGLGRSLWMYYGRRGGAACPGPVLCRRSCPRGGLCFDVGCACRQPVAVLVAARAPRWWRSSRSPTSPASCAGCSAPMRRSPCARRPSPPDRAALTLLVSPRTPTVTTGSRGFIAAATRVPSFAWVRWDASVDVPATTLDELIAAHGMPDFVKIDVEGMEHEVLAGLSRPVPAVSFEFVPSRAGRARWPASTRLERWATYRVQRLPSAKAWPWSLPIWVDARDDARWLVALDPAGALRRRLRAAAREPDGGRDCCRIVT